MKGLCGPAWRTKHSRTPSIFVLAQFVYRVALSGAANNLIIGENSRAGHPVEIQPAWRLLRSLCAPPGSTITSVYLALASPAYLN